MKNGNYSFFFLSFFLCFFAGLPVLGQNTIYVSDLEWESIQVGYDSPQKDRGLEGLPLRLRNNEGSTTTFSKGLCLHAKSKATYNIEDLEVQKFQSYIGINYGKSGGSCKFIVWADNQKLHESEILYETSIGKYLDIDIPATTKKLILETTDGGNGISSDHSIWADAKIILSPDAKVPVQDIGFQLSKGMLEIGQESDVELAVYLLNNELLDLDSPDVSVTYSSSHPAIAAIDNEGKVKGISQGNTTISCTVSYNGVSRTEITDCIVGEGNKVTSWIIKSPDNKFKVGWALNEVGTLSYTAFLNDKKIVSFSPTGIVSNIGDFSKDLVYESYTTQFIQDNYNLIGAKTSHVESQANEITLNFTTENSRFKVITRVYEDGFAFRYGIDTKDGSSVNLRISSEKTALQLPEGSVSQAMSYISHHEAVAYEKKFTDLNEDYIIPFLYHTPEDVWVLLSEAGLSTEYCGAQITGNKNGRLDIIFSEEQKTSVITKTSFLSPWRFVVAGTPKTIVENTMPENLSSPLDASAFTEGTEWINPGVSAWTWLNRESTSDLSTYKKYVDMAVAMGWQYLLLDEGWQPKATQAGYVYYGYFDWTEELIKYANDKGIGLLVWANNSDLNTDQKREKAFSEWQSMGFKGVKPDFFNSQSQAQMKYYDALMKSTAKYKLLLNPHGANKPTGERRTYPNTLTREGVFGAEQDLFKPAEMSARWNCMLPFTRNAVGPADFTPMLSYRVSETRRNYTVSHMAAMAIVYESGIQCLADRTETYLNSPARSLLAAIPVFWDESSLIDGVPGEYVNIARRSGEDWYVGIICNEKREVVLSLDFLDEGTYYAFIYKDGKTFDEIATEIQQVDKSSTITIPVVKTGGASIKITRREVLEPAKVTLDAEQITVEENKKYNFSAKLEPVDAFYNTTTWTSSDESVASITSEGVLTAKKQGKTIITVTTGSTNQITASCEVIVKQPTSILNENWEVLRNKEDNWKLNSNTSVTITTMPGELYPGTASAENIFLTQAKDNNFSFTCKLDFNPQQDYLSAGLIVYLGDDKVFGAYRRYHSSYGGNVLSIVSQNGSSFSENQISDPLTNQEIYLKITKSGSSFSGFYSTDNENWIQIKNNVTNSSLSNGISLKIGLYAVSGNGKTGKIPAVFSNFSYSPDNQSFSLIPFGNITGKEEIIQDNNITILIEGKDIRITTPDNSEVSIYTVTGEKINSGGIPFSCHLEQGVYVLSVSGADGKTESRKILIQ
ncbi:MAG: glycoside hydrolase family 97 catalytic domain-containing protein [Bacteroidales bacterium]|nr:glycoside hydrolase family 97 catalytic domain-containing protein [Bacteroidales bacterium]